MDLNFIPLTQDEDLDYCANLMISSEPWITLGRNYEGALKRLQSDMVEVFIAKRDNATVGFAIIRLKEAFSGYIQTIVIDKNYRSEGIGKKFIGFLENLIFQELPNTFLCVSSFNPDAKRFYESLGYEEVGELTNYVIDGKSEYLMRKSKGSLASYGMN